MRRYLYINYGNLYVDRYGRINDVVLMALFISSEFSAIEDDTALYYEAVEALSNQYYGKVVSNPGPMRCGGEECSLKNQLLWATQMEGFFRPADFVGTHVASGQWQGSLKPAYLAHDGFSYGENSSWFWGNVDEAGLNDYFVVEQTLTNSYPGKPYFIVYSGRRY